MLRHTGLPESGLISSEVPFDPRCVTIIIPQFNQSYLTVQAVQTLRQTDPLPWPVLVVDNGSEPESIRSIHDLQDPSVEVIVLPDAGLTAAWNKSVGHTRSRFLIFLNNDSVSHGPWVQALLAPLIRNETLMAGPELRRETQVTPPVELLAGWCFSLARQTVHAVGGFDPALTLYFSDTDVQLRVRDAWAASQLPPCKVVANLPVVHLSHQTAHRMSDYRSRWMADRDRFLARWSEQR